MPQYPCQVPDAYLILVIDLFYDGACHICRREVDRLRRFQPNERLRFHDIAFPAFRASAWGRDHADLMREVHAKLEDGTWLRGLEVFRHLYSGTRLAPLVALISLPGIANLADWLYRRFAANRARCECRPV